jgi:transcriptional regulator with XRE-family HTH domain
MGYRGKVEAQQRAKELRAQGFTYDEIAAAVGASKSSVSVWCRDVAVDAEAWGARRLASRNFGARTRPPNRLQRAKAEQIEAGCREGAARIGALTERDLLVAGAALYAGEGSKTGLETRFGNSDPRMVALFMDWLRRCVGVDESQLRVRLYLHEGLDLDAAEEFWSGVTGIPRSRFRTPYRAVADATRRTSKHVHGCATVIAIGAERHRRVLGLVEALLHSAVPNPG